MQMNKPRPSIKDQGGIEQYLNSTAAQHHGFSYDRFKFFCSLGLSAPAIGKLMNVHSDTVKNWRRLMEEQG